MTTMKGFGISGVLGMSVFITALAGCSGGYDVGDDTDIATSDDAELGQVEQQR